MDKEFLDMLMKIKKSTRKNEDDKTSIGKDYFICNPSIITKEKFIECIKEAEKFN